MGPCRDRTRDPNSFVKLKHCFLTALYCLIMIQAVSRESKHKHIFGQTLKLQSAVVTLNISSRSSKYNKLFSASKTMYLCKFGGENTTDSEDKAHKRLNKDDDLES